MPQKQLSHVAAQLLVLLWFHSVLGLRKLVIEEELECKIGLAQAGCQVLAL